MTRIAHELVIARFKFVSSSDSGTAVGRWRCRIYSKACFWFAPLFPSCVFIRLSTSVLIPAFRLNKLALTCLEWRREIENIPDCLHANTAVPSAPPRRWPVASRARVAGALGVPSVAVVCFPPHLSHPSGYMGSADALLYRTSSTQYSILEGEREPGGGIYTRLK